MTDMVRIGVWNCEWPGPRSQRRNRIIEKLSGLDADVLCVTEGDRELLPRHGSTIDSDPDYGYPMVPGRRKVLLWSRQDWIIVDQFGSSAMPEGRFVSAVTETPAGALTVMGVCIPWHTAHVTSGRKDRKPWEDHLAYLHGLEDVLLQHQGQPLVVVGDFNQTVPRSWQPKVVSEALTATLSGLVEIATAGKHPDLDKQLIDHVAHSRELKPVSVAAFSRFDSDGLRLSDHSGAVVELTAKG